MTSWQVKEQFENKIAHRVYDLSIEDMDERRAKSVVFPTGEKTAQYLCIEKKYLYEIRVPGKQYFSKKHGKKFAIRIEKTVTV